MKSIIYLIVLFFCFFRLNAQLPVNDSNWQTLKDEQFNSFNSTDWFDCYSWTTVNGGAEYMNPSQVSCVSGWLKLKAEKLVTPVYVGGFPYYYKSGAIQSKFSFKYGYCEMSGKFPVGMGYWPAFWTLGGGIVPYDTCSLGCYHEIDITEPGGLSSSLGNQTGVGYHWRDSSDCIRYANWGLENLPWHTSDEHKYAVFWEPHKMSIYFDDVLIRVYEDPTYTPDHAMGVLLNLAIDPSPLYSPNSSTTFPAYLEINYLKISQLIPDCATNENFCSSAFNPATYSYGVKQSVTIGGAGCANPSTINTSNNVSFWATDYVLIDEGTTINENGSGSFSIQITECPN